LRSLSFRHLDLANSYPETGNWFDPGLTIESVGREPGDLKTLDVNVCGLNIVVDGITLMDPLRS